MLAASLALCLSAIGGGTPFAPVQKKGLTIERLYSQPRLIGTAPRELAWASDGRRLAFLWNDEGTNFYDLWMTGVDRPSPVRLTRMPRPVEGAAGAERDSGVSAVAWSPDGKTLLLTFHGDLYTAKPGEEPAAFADDGEAKSQAAYSPDGRWVSYVSRGDVFLAEAEGAAGAGRRLTTIAKDEVSV
ncbi:MAG TPA: hypothetical protein VE175_13325, partial [Woeseiaceae bacterium]|nr:hypothetical protein [Woeseiaceae bacterium]